MNDLIELIKNAVAAKDQQIDNINSEDKKHLDELQRKGFIKYRALRDAPDIVDFVKGINYDKL